MRKASRRASEKLRVVVDTNLLLSAIIVPKSTPNKILQAWKKNLLILLISDPILEELTDVCSRDKFLNKYPGFRLISSELIASLRVSAEFIDEVNIDLPLSSRDPKDNILIECAFSGDADYLVTGDEDLLVLANNPALEKLKIVTANEFLKILEGK